MYNHEGLTSRIYIDLFVKTSIPKGDKVIELYHQFNEIGIKPFHIFWTSMELITNLEFGITLVTKSIHFIICLLLIHWHSNAINTLKKAKCTFVLVNAFRVLLLYHPQLVSYLTYVSSFKSQINFGWNSIQMFKSQIFF